MDGHLLHDVYLLPNREGHGKKLQSIHEPMLCPRYFRLQMNQQFSEREKERRNAGVSS